MTPVTTPRVTRTRSNARVSASLRTLNTSVQRADTSRQVDPDYTTGYMGSTAPISPPYELTRLAAIFEQSNMLRQCVAAYVTNIAMYGWEIVQASEDTPIDEEERLFLQTIIDSPNSDESLRTIHALIVESYERIGHGYVEVIRDRKGRVSLLRHAASSTMGVCPRNEEPVLVSYDVARGARTVQVQEIKRFRIYRQQQGGRFVFFKEFGDPRRLNCNTGIFASPGNPVSAENEATELIHFRQTSEDVYGIPRWISQLPSILGSREAEEVNLRYFEDNTVPPMILTVAGGRLTGESFRELKAILNAKTVGKERQHQIMLLEAVAERESLDDKGANVTLQVEKLTDSRPSDALFTAYDEANQAKVRSCFRLPPVSVGLSQDITFACYDEETETLTDHGWVTIDSWQEGMRVACVCPRTGTITMEHPEGGMQLYDVENVSMFRIRTEQQDQCVTPNHRMLYSLVRDHSFSISPIERMVENCRVYLRTAGVYRKESVNLDFLVPDSNYRGGVASLDPDVGSMPMDLLVKWVGYYLADGCLRQQGNAISIGAKKARKLALFEDMHEELQDLGFRVRVSAEQSGTYYTVSHKGMASWLSTNAGTGSNHKRIPAQLWSLGTSQLQTLFDAMMSCDGTWDNRPGRTSGNYSTTSLGMADDVQRLAVLLGYRTALREDRLGTFGTAPVYRVLMSTKETCQVLIDKHVFREDYSGRVYCFTVSTGVFITRRNGKVAMQGNTANVSTFVVETQVFGPERTAYDEVWNKRLVNHPLGLNLKSVSLRSKAPVVTNPEILIRSLTALNVMGAVTPRVAREAANKILQIEMPAYPEVGAEGYAKWMDEPIIFATKTGSGNEGIDPEGKGNTHAGQGQKDNNLKALENIGDPSVPNPEHGQE